MYILFINSGGTSDIFFAQFNNNSNNKKLFNSTHVSWVGLGWTYVMG